ncbi:MAG: glycosyltransferase [Desulfobacterales bacterium]|nr:MAG: glycosyltransferase [Desulfobacterales bacterium]
MVEKFANDAVAVSVIIASYNSANVIQACLNSLRQQKVAQPFEIVVADSSNDGTDRLIETLYPEVRLVRLSKRTYPGPARNAAVQASQGEILAFLDSDCTVPADWVAQIVKAHQAGRQIVGGAVLNGTQHSYVGTAEHISEFSEYSPLQKAGSLRMVPTCNLSIRRKIFEGAGTFESVETGRQVFKSEDELLCCRIGALGYKIHFNPAIKVYHHNRVKLQQFLRNQVSLGFGLAVVSRLVVTRRSRAIMRYSSLSFLIPLLKAGILLRRMVSYGPSELLKLLFHFPLIFLGSCYYTMGFTRGFDVPLKTESQSSSSK